MKDVEGVAKTRPLGRTGRRMEKHTQRWTRVISIVPLNLCRVTINKSMVYFTVRGNENFGVRNANQCTQFYMKLGLNDQVIKIH